MKDIKERLEYDKFLKELENSPYVTTIGYYQDNKGKPISNKTVTLRHMNLPFSIHKYNKGYKALLFRHFHNEFRTPAIFEVMSELCYVRIKSCKDSIELFGLKKLKNLMLESKELYNIADIILDFKCKKDGVTKDIIEVVVPGALPEDKSRNIKFLLSDLEIIYPDLKLEIKGYTPKMDRKVRVNSHIKVARKNKQNINIKTLGVVKKLEHIGNKSYSLVAFKDLNKSVMIETKKLKLINNGNIDAKKEENNAF